MSSTDPRIGKLFQHVRAATDLLEQIMLSQSPSRENLEIRPSKNDRPQTGPTDQPAPERLAYTLKEVQEIVGISRSAIYLALTDGDLRAVKAGRRTLVLARIYERGSKNCLKNANDSLARGFFGLSKIFVSCYPKCYPEPIFL